MSVSRRRFLQAGAIGAVGGLAASKATGHPLMMPSEQTEELDRVAAEPVLQVDDLAERVEIQRMELLHVEADREWLVRVRSTEGAEGVAVTSSGRFREAYPLLLHRVAPFFEGRDARDLEAHLWDLYRHGSSYKYQGMLFWCCVAAAEMAILDMLGGINGKSIAQLLGGIRQTEMPIYYASGHRQNTPEEEAEHLQGLVESTGAKAVKFKVGGRMSRNADSIPGRSEALIPLARETLGPDIMLYTDANSSYDVPHAVRLGHLQQEYGYGFFEEPVPFDHLEETRQCTQELDIPIAWGEQEFSAWRFRWMIQNGGVDVVQPDLHYYGGYIRSMRVARMADYMGLIVQPHMSGWGTGFIDLLHYHAAMPNPGPFQEYKGQSRVPVESDTSSLRPENGVIQVPTGPGLGITVDPDYIEQARRVTV